MSFPIKKNKSGARYVSQDRGGFLRNVRLLCVRGIILQLIRDVLFNVEVTKMTLSVNFKSHVRYISVGRL